MKLVRHLAWHAVRAHTLPMLVFAALVAFEAAWVISGYVPDDQRSVIPWMPWVRALLTSVLAGLIVQGDALVGTTAFWRTRPISRGMLFTSKLLALAVTLVVVPAALLAYAWGQSGLLWADALAVGRTIAVDQTMVVLITAMAAVVTASLTHLVIAGVAGVALVTLINGVLLPAIMTTWPFVGGSLFGIRPAWYLGTLFAFGLVAIAHQYLTLREWRTAALVAVALAAAAVPPRLLAGDADLAAVPVNRTVVDPDAVTLSVVAGSVMAPAESALANPTLGRIVDYSAAITADGLNDGVFLRPLSITGRVEAGGEQVPFELTRASVGTFLGAPSPDAAFDGLQHALNPARLLFTPLGRYRRVHLARIDREAALRLAGRPQVLTADLTIAAGRYRVAGAAPVRVGARLAVRGNAFEILAVNPGDMNVLEVRYTNVWLTRATPFGMWSELCLRNRVRNEAVRLGHYRPRAVSLVGTLGIAGGRVSRSVDTLRPRASDLYNSGLSSLVPLIDADWLAGAELVYLDIEELGTFTRPLRAEFTVPDGAQDR